MDEGAQAGRAIAVALPGPELTPPVERALADIGPAGVVLFARNLRTPGQARDLITGLREVVPLPVFVAVDQEGGSVNRMKSLSAVFERLPPARAQAEWAEEHVEEVWFAVGEALAAVGFDVDFAPVVDLDDGPGTNAVGPRSFGTDPGLVAARAARVLAGLRHAGIAGCLKHFPGLGGADADTHFGPSRSPHGERELRERHTSPYRVLAADAPMVMTCHSCFPAVEGPDAPPATFSRLLVHDWLRGRIGYDGLVISDDLAMAAVASGGPGRIALSSLGAGADVALFCQDLDSPRRARDEVAAALVRGDLSATAVAHSARRLTHLLAAFPGGRSSASGWGGRFDTAVGALADLLGAGQQTG